jgi:hypothetical protein
LIGISRLPDGAGFDGCRTRFFGALLCPRYRRGVLTVVSPHLAAVDAAWDDGPDAGRWIAERLGPFGPSVGHAVPLGYPAYAVVPVQFDDDAEPDPGYFAVIDAVLDLLGPFTGEQSVHSGMWDGWSWWYETGSDVRAAAGRGLGFFWPENEARPPQEEIDRQLAGVRDQVAAKLVERPDAEALMLPYREYVLWTGPLQSATAFRHHQHNPPSLVWPEDRSWFVGAPIYTNELAIAGTTAIIDAVLSRPAFNARRATPDNVLDIDD